MGCTIEKDDKISQTEQINQKITADYGLYAILLN
jgi:hypothetical protein